MSGAVELLMCCFASLVIAISATVVEHTFHVGNLTLRKLCREQVIIAVNGQLPGPTIHAHEGDTVIVTVINESPYNMTIHWHGIFQIQSPWADGADHVTQCPILPGSTYTYRFQLLRQHGTFWWHAHVSWLRATVHGALIVYPNNRKGPTYPFSLPYSETIIMLGEWHNANVVDVINDALRTGALPKISDAFTINGKPGYNYPCSDPYLLIIDPGKTYLLRIINSAINAQHFFQIAQHTLTVVAIDGSYTTPYPTRTITIASGQTIDALLTADQQPSHYTITAKPYISSSSGIFDTSTTSGILRYIGAAAATTTIPATLPAQNDTTTAHRFYSSLTSLAWKDQYGSRTPDINMFMTIGLGLLECPPNQRPCMGPLGQKSGASINNVSFQGPTSISMLEAHFHGVKGIFTGDFPDVPNVRFDYTSNLVPLELWGTVKGTRVKVVPYGSHVQVVLQDTGIGVMESHPMHLHGFSFEVMAMGFGNYDDERDGKSFNYRNPQMRNTVAVPRGGWVVIRFIANNPGIWFFHCHFESHLAWGMSMAFLVENGPSNVLVPPPHDLPKC